MNFTIVGAGAIGGTLGAYLVRAGHEVLFVDLVSEHVDAINANGLTLRGYDQTFVVQARAVLPGAMPRNLQNVILAVKSPATQQAANMIAAHLAPDGCVVSAQNGLNELWIADAVGAKRTIGCFVNFSATYLAPGVCVMGGPGAFWIGELDGADTPRIHALQSALSAWAVPGDARRQVRITPKIWHYLWGKMGYGAMLFATALSDESMADAIDGHRDVMVRLVHEIAQIAQAEGVALEGFDGYDPAALTSLDAARIRQSLDALVAVRRADTQTHSGVWRDLAIRKRKTEVDAQFGPVLARADAHAIAAPMLRGLVRLIHEIEDGQRVIARVNLETLLLLG